MIAARRPRLFRFLAEFRADLKRPLPDTDGLSRRRRLVRRFRFLAGKYGWKLVVALIVFYLIRDLTLYVLIPYLIASRLIGC